MSDHPEGGLLLDDLVLDGAEVLHPGHQHLGVLHPPLSERLGHLRGRSFSGDRMRESESRNLSLVSLPFRRSS